MASAGTQVTIYITHIHLVGGTGHEHIGSVKWQDTAGKTGTSQTADAVKWLQQTGNFARVADGIGSVAVGVVEARTPYLRTYADARWTDNLLALPRF